MSTQTPMETLRVNAADVHAQMAGLVDAMERIFPELGEIPDSEIAAAMTGDPSIAQVLRRTARLFIRAAAFSKTMAQDFEQRYARLAGIVTDPPAAD